MRFGSSFPVKIFLNSSSLKDPILQTEMNMTTLMEQLKDPKASPQVKSKTKNCTPGSDSFSRIQKLQSDKAFQGAKLSTPRHEDFITDYRILKIG